MRRVIDEKPRALNLTTVSPRSAALPPSSAFGTVWGVYHALVNIGMSGQAR
jgi:biopolymer transport protein ExbB